MKLRLNLSIFCILPALIYSLPCDNILLRKEWHTLSSNDKTRYMSAIKDLMNRENSYQAANPEIMSYHDFVELHASHAPWTHGDPLFLPFHRGMIRQFEMALISTKKWDYGLVYWDWSQKYTNWYNDDIFNYIGNSFNTTTYCVTNGVFSYPEYKTNNTYSIENFPLNIPCLHRNNNETKNFHLISNDTIEDLLLSAKDYKTFHGNDTSNYHAMVHAIIGGIVDNEEGGEFANPYYSPVDPIFYFHHGYIDQLWFKWQTLNNNQNMFSYSDNINEHINNIPLPYSSIYNLPNWTVLDMLNLNNDNNILCYTYTENNRNISITIPTPIITTTTIPTTIPTSISSNTTPTSRYILTTSVPTTSTASQSSIKTSISSIIYPHPIKCKSKNTKIPEDEKKLFNFIINKWKMDRNKLSLFFNKIKIINKH